MGEWRPSARLSTRAAIRRRRSWPTRPSTPRRSTAPSAGRRTRRPRSVNAARTRRVPPTPWGRCARSRATWTRWLGGAAGVAGAVQEGPHIGRGLPPLPYLDVIARVKNEFGLPVAAYSVSGEYAMLRAAGQLGWLDEEAAMMEALTGIRRAGAD